MRKRQVLLIGLLLFLVSSMLWAGSGADRDAGGRRTIRLSIFDRNVAGIDVTDNFMTRWIQENFGDPRNVNVEFVPIPRAQEVDMFNILMAANNAPDIGHIYNEAVVFSYVRGGGLLPLDPLLNSPSGRILTEYLGEAVLTWGRWDGIQYATPSKRIEVGATSTFIRKDWLDTLGLPVPTTFREFETALYAFRDRDPGRIGNQLIPMALEAYDPNITWAAATIIDAMLEPMTPRMLSITRAAELARPGTKEALRYLNRLYNDRLLSPNFALDTDKQQFWRDILSGRVGAFIHSPAGTLYGAGNRRDLAANAPEAVFVPIDPFINSQGLRYKRSNDPIGYYLFIPRTARFPELIIDYLAWQTEVDVANFIRSGVEGIHYDYRTPEGIPINRRVNDDIPAQYRFPGDIYYVSNGTDYGSQELNELAIMLANPESGHLHVEALRVANTDRFDVLPINVPMDTVGRLQTTVRNKGNELYVRSIMAPPAQFDQVYDQLYREYLDVGARAIMDEASAAFEIQYPRARYSHYY